MIIIESSRLRISQFQISDAEDVFSCITPAITKFMPWEPPQSFSDYMVQREKRLQTDNENDFCFVIRRSDTMECLGMASLEDIHATAPELGLWIKETAHGHGYGRDTIKALAQWACKTFSKNSFIYPVAIQNAASRRLAEALHGEIIEKRTNPKYDSVVYRIPWPQPTAGKQTA